MSTEEVYDFCLDWQMGHTSKMSMITTFAKKGWDYYSFETKARNMDWFVRSMSILMYAQDFLE